MIILTDIHGCYDTMLALLAKIPQEEKDKGIVICGDLIDRGPKSRQVVQYCIDNNIPVVKGNHEQMMIDNDTRLWYMNGGTACMKSYGAGVFPKMYGDGSYFGFDNPEDMKRFEEHRNWMKSLPIYIEFPEVKKDGRYLVISHSSINGVWKHRNDKTVEDSFNLNVIWGRPNTIKDVPEIYNVFGHTPCQDGPKIKVPFANLDTGCVFKDKPYGVLTALQFPEMIVYTQENIEGELDETSSI